MTDDRLSSTLQLATCRIADSSLTKDFDFDSTSTGSNPARRRSDARSIETRMHMRAASPAKADNQKVDDDGQMSYALSESQNKEKRPEELCNVEC